MTGKQVLCMGRSKKKPSGLKRCDTMERPLHEIRIRMDSALRHKPAYLWSVNETKTILCPSYGVSDQLFILFGIRVMEDRIGTSLKRPCALCGYYTSMYSSTGLPLAMLGPRKIQSGLGHPTIARVELLQERTQRGLLQGSRNVRRG